jgi:hypothetical protein
VASPNVYDSAISNRRHVTQLLTTWLAILSACLLLTVGVSVLGTARAYRNTGRICTAFTSLINDNRMSLDARVVAIHEKLGIYATYSPAELASAVSVINTQLKSFPPYHC